MALNYLADPVFDGDLAGESFNERKGSESQLYYSSII